MRFGEAPTGRLSSIAAMLERRASPSRRLARKGAIYLLTMIFWGLWTYLVMPILSLVLWFLGFQLFTRQMTELGGYTTLLYSLRDYSLVFLGIVLALLLWILWNVVRYGGSKDRRTVKKDEVPDVEIAQAHSMDMALLTDLRAEQCVTVDVTPSGSLVILGRVTRRQAVDRLLEGGSSDPPTATPGAQDPDSSPTSE